MKLYFPLKTHISTICKKVIKNKKRANDNYKISKATLLTLYHPFRLRSVLGLLLVLSSHKPAFFGVEQISLSSCPVTTLQSGNDGSSNGSVNDSNDELQYSNAKRRKLEITYNIFYMKKFDIKALLSSVSNNILLRALEKTDRHRMYNEARNI